MDKTWKNIELPASDEFKKALKRQAIDEGYNSPKDMIEKKTIKGLEEYKNNKEQKNS